MNKIISCLAQLSTVHKKKHSKKIFSRVKKVVVINNLSLPAQNIKINSAWSKFLAVNFKIFFEKKKCDKIEQEQNRKEQKK